MSQLPLDLGHRPALGGDDFLVAPSNEAAVAWLDRWPQWPALLPTFLIALALCMLGLLLFRGHAGEMVDEL